MQPKSRRAARLQGFGLAVATAALAVVLGVRLQRPFDAATLAIPVGELRSQAAEAGLLEREARAGRLAPAFVRRHAAQLAHDVERVRAGLAGKPAVAPLEPGRRRALALADALQARTDALARDGHAVGGDFEVLARALDALETRIGQGR
ncbi:hypothetical protein [Cognatilysobacter segetis]|uniref:hypothetical protein n=1 Tax=Cognatilysobacter segetis TaxID=2492394 RepID=UPI00105FE39B|nr:hypothetical protein [Lysobacter segetis]